ncbi:MAG: histidine kinase [Saonia sp.]
MQLSARKRNRIFWLLQLVGWSAINLVALLFWKKLSIEFLGFSIISGIFTGIVSTSLLRTYLKNNISLERFNVKAIGKITVSTIFAAFLFAGLNFVFGYLYGKYVPIDNELDLQILEVYSSVWVIAINSLFTIFGWVVCYLAIKLFLKLSADRLERSELNTTLRQAQLNTLKGQINPHFMFNSLNNIRGLMLEDVERSRDMLTKLSEMLRYSLTKNDINAIALEEELEMVDNYIELSKIQLEDRLEFVKEVAPQTLSIAIPPMIIQLLVENAAKHGISNIKSGGRILLKTVIDKDLLCIKVINTGKLRITKDSTQLGLQNIRQRLQLLYGNKAVFSLEEENDEVVANIKIPLV